MSRPRIFIDGKSGTTGLQIYDRLDGRDDIDLLVIDEEKRKDPAVRREFLNLADLVFLCLPDESAVEAVGMIENPVTKVIDASTAHRTDPGWAYGFPELSDEFRNAVISARFVSNPGCHASGFIASVFPLVQAGLLSPEKVVCCYSLTGYSGGGRKMIEEFENPDRNPHCKAGWIYSTGLNHKHLPEMIKVCGLDATPVFSPVVGDFYRGMATTVMLPGLDIEDVHDVLEFHYRDQNFISVSPVGGFESVIYPDSLAGTNEMALNICGHDDMTTVTAVFDNLGKGASGAAVQNMNLMLGFSETAGLTDRLPIS